MAHPGLDVWPRNLYWGVEELVNLYPPANGDPGIGAHVWRRLQQFELVNDGGGGSKYGGWNESDALKQFYEEDFRREFEP